MCSLCWHWDPPRSLPWGEREGHVFFKLSVSSVTVSISGLTPLCFFHEGLAFTLSLIMLSYDNRIKRKNTESCPSVVLYAHPNKQLVLGIVLQLACPQPHPFYAILVLNFNHGAVWPRQPSPAQHPSALPLCCCGESWAKPLQSRQHTEKHDRSDLHFHLSAELWKMFHVCACVYIYISMRKRELHSLAFSTGPLEAGGVLTCLLLCCERHFAVGSWFPQKSHS